MSEELKSCPFCGGKAIVDTDDKFAWVHCVNCDSGTAGWRNRTLANKDSINTAIRIWNTRPEEPRCDRCNNGLNEYNAIIDKLRIKCCILGIDLKPDFYCKRFERKEDDE